MSDERDLIGVRAAARQLDVHENTIRNWEKSGVLSAIRVGAVGYRRFAREDIERMRHEMLAAEPAPSRPDCRSLPCPRARAMSAFFVVEADGYSQHWPTFELALADFLRLLNDGLSEDVALRFSS